MLLLTQNKEFDTLLGDLKSLLEKDTRHIINEDNLKSFLKTIEEVVRDRLFSSDPKTEKSNNIRVSLLGTPNRKLWYKLNQETSKLDSLDYATKLKFTFGDLIEGLLLFLIKESGHVVTGEQGEVNIDGVIGHRDCQIDGVTSDIKTASKWGFEKFEKGTLFKDDPFGYIAQLSSYCAFDKCDTGAFIAFNKESGEISILKLDKVDMINPEERVKEVKEVLSSKEPPKEKCYEPIEDGSSGNLVLSSGCRYCPFKDRCWKDANNGQGLLKYKYSNGVKEFVRVLKEPKVERLN